MPHRAPCRTVPLRPVSLLTLLLILCCWLPSPRAGAADGLTLAGQVTDENYRPVAGARIEIRRPESRWEERRRELAGDGRQVLATVISDQVGRYRVEVPEPGFYEISADAEGRVSHSFLVGPVFGDEVVGDAILTPAETVAVRVVDGDGAPLAGARVAVAGDGGARASRRGPFPTRLDRTGRQSVRTGEDGTARFERREGETLAVTAMAPGHAPGRLQKAGGTTLTVRLERGEALPVEVRAADGEAVAGAVVAIGSPGLAVGLTGEDGRLVLTRDPAKDARISVIAEDGRRRDETVEARTAKADTAEADKAQADQAGVDRAGDPDSLEPRVLTLPPSFTITGRTLGAGEREPVAGAWIWTSYSFHRPTRSDSRGNFTFALPQQGRPVYLRADAPGRDATVVQMRPAQATADEPVTLLLRPTISASGRVIDSAGRPVAGAEVWAESRDDRVYLIEPGDESFTDADGRFHLAALTADTPFTLNARQEGYAPGSHQLGPVPTGTTVEGLEVVLPAAITAFGRVVDLDENPVRGAEVTLIPAPESNDIFALARQQRNEGDPPLTTTGPDGRFEFTGLAEGRFDLSAEANGFAPLAVPGLELPEPGTRLDLGTLVLEPGLHLEGRVVDPDGRGIEGATVSGRPAGVFGPTGRRDNGEENAVKTGPDGRFVLEDLARGRELDVTARADGYIRESLVGVKVPSEEPLTLELTPGATISGIVVDGDGAPVEWARVRTETDPESGRPSARHPTHGFSDEAGRFTVEEVTPGRVAVSVDASGFLDFEERGLEVVSGEDLDGLRFELERGHSVGGRVFDSSGRPLPEARVTLVRPPSAPYSAGSSATTDPDGVYEMTGVPAGEHTLAAEHHEFLRRVRDLTVVAGENRLDFRLQPGLSVSGRVVDEGGSPVAGASVALIGGDSFPNLWGDVGERTGEAGDFRIEGVEPGVYKVTATKEGYVTRVQEEPVEVTAGSPVAGLELRLAKGAVVRGRLLGAELSQLANATVMALPLGTQGVMPLMAGIDYEVRFRLEGVSEGDWRLMAILAAGQPAGQEEFSVGAGQRELVVDLDLGADEASLRGQIRLGGEPLTNAVISLTGQETSQAGFGRTDHRGRFEVRSLVDGTYDLTILPLGSSQSHSRSVEIQGDTELDLDIPVSTVEGVVLAEGEPVEGATVRLRRTDDAGGFRAPVTTDRSGRFRLTRLPAGAYRLRGEAPGHSPGEIEVAVEAGVPATDLEIRLGPGSSLELVVTATPYGRIPKRVMVTALDPASPGSPAEGPPDGGPGTVYGDVLAVGEGGRVRLDGLPAGRWDLLVTSTGTAVVRREVTSPGPPVAVTLLRSHDLTVRIPALAEAARLGQVWLTGGDGRPFLQPHFRGGLRSNWALQDGQARIRGLPPGRWTVTASTPDGRTWSGSAVTAGGAPAEVVLE